MKIHNQGIKTIIQVFFFLLVGLIAVNHTLAESGAALPFFASASVHAICPFGGVETLYQLLTTGDYIQKIHSSALVLMGIVFTLTILFGPVFCGWVCPLGSIQEWIGKIGKRIFGKRYNQFMPKKVDQILRYLRYILLALVMYNTARSGMLLFANVDPYFALYHFWTGETAIAALVILGITLVLSLFVERAWCKYACPYGAVLGLFNPIRIFTIKREAKTCIDCGNCDRACPMNIEVSAKQAIRDHQCISCLKCTSENSCPIENTVELMPFMKTAEPSKTKVKGSIVGILVFLLMFGGIAATSALGYWSTANEALPDKLEQGSTAGSYDPEDIRGSYALRDVATLFDIPESVLMEAFGLPQDIKFETFKSKNIEALYEGASVEIGNDSLKIFVALYKNLPIVLTDSYLPEAAVALILENNPSLTEEQKQYLSTHTYKVEASAAPAVTAPAVAPAVAPGAETTATATAPAETASTAPAAAPATTEPAVNGQTTFQGLLDLGITKAQIEEILQAPMPMTNLSVRSYCQDNGLAFSEIKAALTALVE